jgi:peroxiredoxin
MGGGKMLKVGADAPKFDFTDIDGNKGSVQTFAEGKPLLLVFLQTACRSCQREMAFLKQLKADGADMDILVVFVDMKERDFKGYATSNELPFVFFWDNDYSIAEQFGVSFTPSSFLLDKDRKIAKVYRGWSRAGHSLEGDFKKLAEQ